MKLSRLLIVLLLALARTAAAAPFDIASIGVQQYKADDYIRAAVALQAMGREGACQALLASAKTNPGPDLRFFVLCRMLFTQRGTNEFRHPYYYRAYIIGDLRDWRLAPIELVDGMPFLLTANWGAADGGGPESAENYLQYCMANCDWNTYSFREVTPKQKSDALAKFLSSNKFQRRLTDFEQKFFSAQIE
ncbi:MAG: hypothetical protein ABSA47_15980 [Verrucomicrobiota bacterium]|jgi:hypothetical protein